MSTEKPAKDRALLATMAASIAGGLAGIRDVYTKGRSIDHAPIIADAVKLARGVLAEIDKPEPPK